MILIYGTPMWNDSISRLFSFFQNFDFSKRAKNGPKWQILSFALHPYLRNHTSYYCYLWYTFVKCFNIFRCFFQKGQNQSRMTKSSICCTLYLRNHTSYECNLWCKCGNWKYLWVLFLNFDYPGCQGLNRFNPSLIFSFFFFKIFVFGVISGVGGGGCKGAKNCPNCQKILSVSLHISGTVHHIWWRFLIHKCKMMISPANLFIFQNFDMWVF